VPASSSFRLGILRGVQTASQREYEYLYVPRNNPLFPLHIPVHQSIFFPPPKYPSLNILPSPNLSKYSILTKITPLTPITPNLTPKTPTYTHYQQPTSASTSPTASHSTASSIVSVHTQNPISNTSLSLPPSPFYEHTVSNHSLPSLHTSTSLMVPGLAGSWNTSNRRHSGSAAQAAQTGRCASFQVSILAGSMVKVTKRVSCFWLVGGSLWGYINGRRGEKGRILGCWADEV
jgi:hypothetical protein